MNGLPNLSHLCPVESRRHRADSVSDSVELARNVFALDVRHVHEHGNATLKNKTENEIWDRTLIFLTRILTYFNKCKLEGTLLIYHLTRDKLDIFITETVVNKMICRSYLAKQYVSVNLSLSLD